MQELVVTHDVLRATVHRAGPPTCVSNDNGHEMVHVGWTNGGISVYRPIITEEVADVVHWSSFPAHRSAVYETYGSYGAGIYSVSARTFTVHSHGGAELFSQGAPAKSNMAVKPSDMASQVSLDEFRCFAFTSTTRAILGTQSGRIWESDLQYGRFSAASIAGEGLQQECSKLRVNERGSVLMGTSSGSVHLWDPRSRRTVTEFKATSGGKIADMDVSGDLAVTCGFSAKNAREPFVRVFDMRTYRQLPPLQFLIPAGVRFVPNPFLSGSPSSSVLVVSANGNLRLTDIRGDGSSDSFARVQSGNGNIEGLATSCTGKSFSLVDSAGHLHVWSTNISAGWSICDPTVLEGMSFPEIEHPHPVETGPTSLSTYPHWMVDDPCASYPLPFLPTEGVSLLSDFPPSLLNRTLRNDKASLKIHPDVLAKVSQRDYIGYVANTEGLPGQALLFGTEHHAKAYADADPREPVGERSQSNKQEGFEAEEEGSTEDVNDGSKKQGKEIKRRYGRQDVSAAQVTISEYDFREVNSTQFAGLDVDYDPNSFANAPFQALYFLPEFRAAVLSQPFSSKPVCIPTETAVLFRLLDMARRLPSKDKACQARNFLRAFRLSPDALALGLLDVGKLPNDRKAGVFLRFLFTQFLAAGGDVKASVEGLFGTKLSVQDTREVGNKKQTSTREISSVVLDLVDEENERTFEDSLAHSLRQERKHRSWDDTAKTYANVTTVKSPVSLPLYLAVNCADLNAREEPLTEDYLCECFGYNVEKSKVVSLRKAIEPPPGGSEIYDVVGVVSRITDVDRFAKGRISAAKQKKGDASEEAKDLLDGHLILHVKIQDDYGQTDDENLGRPVRPGTWMLFNDICVSLSNSSEALDFSTQFRAPALLIFKKRINSELLAPEPPRFMVSAEVFATLSIAASAKKQNRHAQQASVLPIVALINSGDLIAIDCEFVALTNDVYDIRPDGSKVVIAPSRRALARVSCLSGDGKILMDDYVAQGPEPVADYLTRFSGLMPGDLDPATSTKHLLPHRVVYNKLLYLIEKKCVFVGHGLNNDFRVLNVVVPPEQARDTLDLFWVKGQRKLSLRFLSSVLLQEDIQGRVHDSIQDAKAALELYKLYIELDKTRKLDETLKRLYLEGPMRNWS